MERQVELLINQTLLDSAENTTSRRARCPGLSGLSCDPAACNQYAKVRK